MGNGVEHSLSTIDHPHPVLGQIPKDRPLAIASTPNSVRRDRTDII